MKWYSVSVLFIFFNCNSLSDLNHAGPGLFDGISFIILINLSANSFLTDESEFGHNYLRQRYDIKQGYILAQECNNWEF